MWYLIRTPFWFRWIYPSCEWEIPDSQNVYLTFDDGPHPEATPYVLDLLKKYNARATFFCIGKNVKRYPELFKRILQEGHRVGNHTFNHENGWETEDNLYFESIAQADEFIRSELFRPPYGRISRKQVKYLKSMHKPYRIIMWSVISADFDISLSGEQCARNVIKNLKPGQLVVMHDSGKALERLKGSLQPVLEHCKKNGWGMEVIKKVGPG